MHRLLLSVTSVACGAPAASTTSLHTGTLANPHVSSTATGAFLDGDYAIRIDVQTTTDAVGTWLESVGIGATDMAAYNDMTLEEVDVYLDDARVDVPAPVVGWDFEGTPQTPVPSRIHGRATVWNGDYVEFDYDMGLLELQAIDAPTAGATLPFGADVPVRWSPSGGDVGWSIGLWRQQAQTDWVADDVGSGSLPAAMLTEAGDDTLWVARSSGALLACSRCYFAHLHEARVAVVVGP